MSVMSMLSGFIHATTAGMTCNKGQRLKSAPFQILAFNVLESRDVRIISLICRTAGLQALQLPCSQFIGLPKHLPETDLIIQSRCRPRLKAPISENNLSGRLNLGVRSELQLEVTHPTELGKDPSVNQEKPRQAH